MIDPLEQLRTAEEIAYANVRAAAHACESLVTIREILLPRVINAYRDSGKSQHEVERFAESLHANEPALARYLLRAFAGTALARWVLTYGRETLSADSHRI